jgi:nucleoside-diphosphate-sugar epimerase
MRVLLTGASGFIGKGVLAHKNEHVDFQSIVRDSTLDKPENASVITTINSQTDWSKYLRGANVIVHLAGIAHTSSVNPIEIEEVNYKATVNLAQQASKSGVQRFIFISSIGVLGNSIGKPFDENSIVSPLSDCAISKLKAEEGLMRIAQETELEIVIIRPVLVCGAGAPGNFGKLVKLIQQMPFLPFALCCNKRSFISVNNLVDFISVCIAHPKAKNEIFCISDGNDVSIREFTDGIATGLNKKVMQLPIPVSILKLLGKIAGKSESIEQLIGDLQVDSSKARELLDWIPPVTMTETFSKLTNNK